MKYIWCVVNVGLIILSVFGGYSLMSPERLRQENPDEILCLILLVVMPLFALGSVLIPSAVENVRSCGVLLGVGMQ